MSKPSIRLRTGEDYTRASFVCPLCGQRTTSSSVDRHRAKAHPELDKARYLEALRQGLKGGNVRFELSGKSFEAVTGTKVMAEVRKTHKGGVAKMYRAGAPGLKKART